MKTDDEHIKYYAKERLDVVARMVLTFMATLWLMVPVFVFYWVASKGLYKDMIVLVFTMGFAMFLAIFTKAKRHEIFAATAAYVAPKSNPPLLSAYPSITFALLCFTPITEAAKFFTILRSKATLIAKCRYCAVLVVFISNSTLHLDVQGSIQGASGNITVNGNDAG